MEQEKKVNCAKCGASILTQTAEKFGGLCAPCRKSFAAQIGKRCCPKCGIIISVQTAQNFRGFCATCCKAYFKEREKSQPTTFNDMKEILKTKIQNNLKCINCDNEIDQMTASKQNGLCKKCYGIRICDVCGKQHNDGIFKEFLLVKSEMISNYPYTTTKYTAITSVIACICKSCFQQASGYSLFDNNKTNNEIKKRKGFGVMLKQWWKEWNPISPEDVLRPIATNKLNSLLPSETDMVLNPPWVTFGSEPRYYIETIDNWRRRGYDNI
jgi:hypothetical protein